MKGKWEERGRLAECHAAKKKGKKRECQQRENGGSKEKRKRIEH